jgi:predicted dehydrogenase
MPTPVGIGIIGAGDVAGRDYLPEIHRLEGAITLRAICARRERRAREAAERYAVPRDVVPDWYTSVGDVLAREDVGAIVNLTPFAVHAEVTRAALEAGKHVYTEKPLAATGSEARKLADVARRRGLVLACAPSVMVFPQLLAAQEIVRSGALGKIHTARARCSDGVPPWHGYSSDPTPFFAADVGPLVDLGVYPLHAITGLLGPVRRVAAMSTRTRTSFVVEDGPAEGKRVAVEAPDNWHLTLELDGGALASIETNYCSAGSPAPGCELLGERGGIALDPIDCSAPLGVNRPGDDGWVSEAVPHQRTSGPDHILGVAHMVECVSGDRELVLTPEHAIHVVDVIEAARRSVIEGRSVPVVSTF